MTNRSSVLMLLAIAVVGIYVLPSVTARFAGSHTMEVNKTLGMTGLDCAKCHSYIFDELNASASSQGVLGAHRGAALNDAFVYNVTDGGTATLDTDNSGVIEDSELCQFCHRAKETITGAHTQVYVRVCTDTDCHGAWKLPNGTVANDTYMGSSGDRNWEYTAAYIGQKLANTTVEPHANWFRGMWQQNSTYIWEDEAAQGTNYRTDYYACLACHTHVGMTIKLTRPNTLVINISKVNITAGTEDYTLYDIYVDLTNATTTQTTRTTGSVW